MGEEFNFDELNFDENEENTKETLENENDTEEENEVPDVKVQSEEEPDGDEGDDEDNFDDDNTPSVEDLVGKNSSAKKSTKNTPASPKVEPKPAYTGPRKVIVYGEELFTENDPKVTNEEIRQRIYNNFQYKEFTKERAIFELIESEQILHVSTRFEKKG